MKALQLPPGYRIALITTPTGEGVWQAQAPDGETSPQYPRRIQAAQWARSHFTDRAIASAIQRGQAETTAKGGNDAGK